jgi:molecular chaperone DnaK
MKRGQAIYEKQAAAEASPSTDGDAGPQEEVVDAEFSEVDDNKA